MRLTGGVRLSLSWAALCLMLSACPTRVVFQDAGADSGRSTGGNAGTTLTGAGGMSGASGKHSLGSTCSDGTECSSGFCADGLCCDSACNRVCEQCSVDGSCTTAIDDSRCGTIPCPKDTACIDFATAITSSRCASRNACKSQKDCPFLPVPAGTLCGGTSQALLFCDGQGSCDQQATVGCGADPTCPTAPGACCYDVSGSGQTTSCVQDATTCLPANRMRPCFATVVQCDDPGDCASGDVCCYSCGLGWSVATAACMAASECDPNAANSSHQRICKTDSDCIAGETCQPPGPSDNLPAGYKLCKAMM
jgi:hypothetical protein